MTKHQLIDSSARDSDFAAFVEEVRCDRKLQIEQLKQHDLWDFWNEANDRIAKQYEKLRKRAASHPSTAGDQGEIDWKCLLEQWLPRSYSVVTQGRLLFDGGTSSKELDLIVLKPSYPKAMLDHKYYLVSGVAAAFECKRTLQAKHIEDAVDHSAFIQSKLPARLGTPRDELYGPIILGLLAHAHSWSGIKSKPIDNISKLMGEAVRKRISHPRELIDLVCVGNLAAWCVQKMPEFWRQAWFGYNCSSPSPAIIEALTSTLSECSGDRRKIKKHLGKLSLEQSAFLTFLVLKGPKLKIMPSVGFALCGFLEMMAWQDESLRWAGKLYSMYRLFFDHGGPQWGKWDLSVYSKDVVEGLMNGDHRGLSIEWNPWSWV
jgi:hypothetical protein